MPFVLYFLLRLDFWQASSYRILSYIRQILGPYLLSGFATFTQNEKTHYEVLGVKPNATKDEIKDAYLRLTKEVLPTLVIQLIPEISPLLNRLQIGLR